MARATTDTHTTKRLDALARENRALRQRIRALEQTEERFQTIIHHANDEILLIDTQGKIVEINDRCETLFGLQRQEVIGKHFADFGYLPKKEMKEVGKAFRDVLAGRSAHLKELRVSQKDGSTRFVEVNPRIVSKGGKASGVLIIIRDITERKKIEAELQQYRDHLEETVRERTTNLEEANTALRVMLTQAQEVRREIENKMQFNITTFLVPYLEKLKQTRLTDVQRSCIEHLENHLNDIDSPDMHGISTKFLKLTPTELQIANLIKQGRTTKEISEHLNLATKTVETHRYKIRTKLGLVHSKDNLRTYLLSVR